MSSGELVYDTDVADVGVQKSACLSEDPCSLYSTPDDIYELATDIGHDFEKLVQTYGYDAFSKLLPKVVHALESLESSLKKSESVTVKLNEMKQSVIALEKERVLRNNDRLKFENDVDEMEALWRCEKAELLASIQKLSDENGALLRALEANTPMKVENDTRSIQTSPFSSPQKVEDHTSKHIIAHIQEEIITLRQELDEKKRDCDSLSSQVDKLTRQNASVLEQNLLLRQELDAILEEKSDLEASLATNDKKIKELSSALNIMRQKERDEVDLSKLRMKYEGNLTQDKSSDVKADEYYQTISQEAADHCGLDVPRSIHLFQRHFSLEDASTGTPLPDLDLSDGEERVVYGPLPREPDDKAEPDESKSIQNKSIRDFFERMFSKFLDKKGIPLMLPV